MEQSGSTGHYKHLESVSLAVGYIMLISKDHFLDVDGMPEYLRHRVMDVSQQMVAAIKNHSGQMDTA